MEIPVYVFTGFLDSGKTTFLQSTLEDKRFNNGERTLVLLCEEGECELDPSRFSGKNVTIEIVDDVSVFNPDYLKSLLKSCRAQRVLVEYNGMWLLNDFYEQLPKGWIVYQEMMFADATTFASYNANMRNLVFDKIQGAQMIAFNRCVKGFDKMALHKIVRGVSRGVDIVYDYGGDDVEYDDIEDPLPFDKSADTIVIEDRDFALWYRDLTEELSAYDNKRVQFKGQVVIDKTIPENCFIVGRPIMTCCEDDIRFGGLVCQWDQCKELANRMWVTVTADVSVRKHPCYGRVGPVLSGISVAPADTPESAVATFY